MKAMAFETHARQLCIGDGDARRVGPAIELSSHMQARATVRRTDETDDGREIDERGAAPVHRDVREQTVLDLVPLARARREVTDRDGEPRAIRELLQLPLPQPQPRAVTAAGVGGDGE